MPDTTLPLFGGDLPWSPLDWTDSDDRVRGGKSQSYMTITPGNPVARFEGTLDITALGGAGFASQRTTGEKRAWDLHHYDGIEVEIERARVEQEKAPKTFTFILKDTLLPPDPTTSREQSTISYEYDFTSPDALSPATSAKSNTLRIPFSAFAPVYRGRPATDAPSLNTYRIARQSFMCRSHFGAQQGRFALGIIKVAAYKTDKGLWGDFWNSTAAIPVVLIGGTAGAMAGVVWIVRLLEGWRA